ncbi:MAG: hypothetical protein HYX48_07085 [Chlamydiales bacterium]|nr:hypothetical protein [Chlamydiales bacterium]
MIWPFAKKKNKIELFVRHCHFSAISGHKKRIPNLTREICFENLLQTIQGEEVNVTFLLDTFHPMESAHFVKAQQQFPVVEIREGTESGSFLRLLEYVDSLKLDPETIVYFLEDDYMHKKGWPAVLREGFTIPGVDYVTLYDHKDKYFLESYTDLRSKIFLTESSHWRSTPSTTNTFATRFKTLQRDMQIQRSYSENVKISKDHEKFCALAERGAVLISPMPGWSTHTELAYASPCVDWEKIVDVKK